MNVEGLDHIALSVRDVEASARWYCDVLGLKREHDDVWPGEPVFVVKGNTGIALFAKRDDGDKPAAIRMLHFAWRTDAIGFESAQRELRERGINFDFQDHEISKSIYFHDPDGHQIEITTYEIR